MLYNASNATPSLVSATHSPAIIMRHLQPGALEPTLDIEALIRLGAVQDGLVAADLLGHEIQGLDDAQAELLALLVLGHSNVLNVSDEPKVVDKLALHDERAGADDVRRGVENREQVVAVGARRHPCVALVPGLEKAY